MANKVSAAIAVAATASVAFIVAPGRTVTTDDGDVGPGGTVMLPATEGEPLRKLGFFLADDGSRLGVDGGPPTNVGDDIKEQ